MSVLLTKSRLDDRQRDFVRRISLGEPPQTAVIAAGYAATEYAYTMLGMPHIMTAVHAEVHKLLQRESGTSLRVLVTLRDAETTPAGIRADISLQLLKMAGHVVPSGKGDAPAKQLHEMTREEMIAYIDRNEAEIRKAEDILAARARPVNAHDSAQELALTEAKPLQFLD